MLKISAAWTGAKISYLSPKITNRSGFKVSKTSAKELSSTPIDLTIALGVSPVSSISTLASMLKPSA